MSSIALKDMQYFGSSATCTREIDELDSLQLHSQLCSVQCAVLTFDCTLSHAVFGVKCYLRQMDKI